MKNRTGSLGPVYKYLRKLSAVILLLACAYFYPASEARAASQAAWSTQADFNTNASTTGTPTSGSSVIVNPNGVTLGTGFTQISGGQSEISEYGDAYAIKSDGSLWVWGDNDFGQLGIGYSTASSPTQLGADTWMSIAAFNTGAAAVKTDGTLWAWGQNGQGELGQGTSNGSYQATPIQIGSGANWKAVFSGGQAESIFAIKTDGTLWAWGNNAYGELGVGDITMRTTPTQVGNFTNWQSISVGGSEYGTYSSFGVQTNGTLWAWGDNSIGELGLGNSGSDLSPTQVGSVTNWKTVSTAVGYTEAIQTNGTLWAWGDNSSNQLGLGSGISSEALPTQVGSSTNWNYVNSGFGTSLAVKTDGTLWAWGNDNSGAFGMGINSYSAATPVQIGTDTNWSQALQFGETVMGIKTTGTLETWGYNFDGELGQGFDGNPPALFSPQQTGSDTHWSVLGGVNSSTLAIKTDGTLWAWGNNSSGQLGLGNTISIVAPTQVGSGTNWQSISDGSGFSLAIKTDGTLWAWGGNTNGQLGLGDTNQRNSPTQVGSGTNWQSIAAGQDFSLAVKTDGTLWTWGDNEYGVLGLGDTNQRNSPTQVGSDTHWKSVTTSADSESALAIKTDGTLWGWGHDNNGQLGIGVKDDNDHTTPAQAGVDTHWKTLAAGINHSLGIKTDGTLWAWGYGGQGQLGQGGDTDDQPSPVQVGVATNWSSIAGGIYYSLATQNNGTLWAWGSGGWEGQLGLGSTTSYNTATQVGSLTNWATVSSGYVSSMAIKTDGTLWGWGEDSSGQLGFADPIFLPTVVTSGSIPASGTLSALEVNADGLQNFGALNWTSVALPVNTTIQLSAAASSDGVIYSSYSSPTTESTVGAASGSADLSGLGSAQFIKILVTLNSTDGTHAPVLTGITLSYAPVPSISSSGGTYSAPYESGGTGGSSSTNSATTNNSTTNSSNSSTAVVTKPITPAVPITPVLPASSSAYGNSGFLLRFLFQKNLSFGQSNNDVLQLQEFLNSNGYVLASKGPGSPGNETKYFGANTKSALAKFQKANGIKPSVGYFGPLTRAFINQFYNN